MPHIIPPYFNISGVISSSGIALSWFKSRFLPQEDFETIYARIASAEPGAEGLVFLPYLAGERSPHWDPNARAVFLGLGLNHDLSTMARAVLEGTAFAIREVLDVMESRGATVHDMRATGTPSLSPIWNQIKADITGKKIVVPASDTATTLGAALLAGVGTGFYQDYEEAVKETVSVTRTHEPDLRVKEIYDKTYETYLELYRSLAGMMTKHE